MLAPLTLFIWDRLPVKLTENAPIKIGASFSSNKLGKWSEEKRNVGRNGKLYSTFTWPLPSGSDGRNYKLVFEVNGIESTREEILLSSPFLMIPFSDLAGRIFNGLAPDQGNRNQAASNQ